MTDVGYLPGPADIGKSARAKMTALVDEKADHFRIAVGSSSAHEEVFALAGCAPRLGVMLEPAGPGEVPGVDLRVTSEARVPAKRSDAAELSCLVMA